MDTARFSIPLLREDRQALDLGNALISVKGVAAVRSDVAGHAVTVEYDTDFTDADVLRRMITHAGYPVGDGQ